MITESLRASITTESTHKITTIIRAQALHYRSNLAGHPGVSVVVTSTGADVYFEIDDYYWRVAYGTILDAIGN